MGKRSSTLHKAASLLLALLVMPAMQCLAQLNTRKPASSASAPNRQAPLVIKKANGTTKTAYGVLGFDLTDGNMLNGLVSFPFTEGARFSLVKYFGDANHDVTAGAYAERYYYAELTQTDLTTQKMIPVELIRYDIEKDVTESVGELSGYTSHINDMSYDYSTKTMYAISVLNDAYTQLFTIDLNTAESKLVADLDRRFFTLACTYEGQLYGISFEGDFCKIDKTNGNVTVVGATGWHPTYYQSMEFDHSDETLYWAANLMGGTDFDDCIATVDINTGAAQKVAAVGNSPQIAGLYVPFAASEKGTPSAVSDFECVPGANGATTVALYWMNPTQTFDGKELSSLTDIKVYRDRELIKTFENPEMGEEMSYTDDLGDVKGGYHFYSVVASNSVGEGAEEKVRIFVGRDIPADITTLTLQHDGYDKAVISWNQPELGPNGGYVDASSLSYKVVRKPDGRVIADGLKQTTVSDENISPVGQYSYSVVVSNADGESNAVETETSVFGPAYSMPVTFDFTAFDADNSWTVMDANKDGYAWMWTKVSSGDRVMGHQASSTAVSDDWLISYYMPFEKDATYRAEMELHAYSADKLEFALLDEMYTVKPAQVLDTVTIKGNRDKQRIGVVFKAKSDGYKNLGIHALSPMRADWLEVFNLSVKKAEKSNLAAVSISGPEKPMAKKESVYTVRVENRGTDKAYAYRVTLVDKNGEELNHKDVAVTLNSGEYADVEVAWTPQVADTTAVCGVVRTWPDDEYADDNTTDYMTVIVREAFDGDVVAIGLESSATASSSPFDLSNQYAAALNIYSADEIGENKDMLIQKMAWPYDALYQYSDVETIPVRIYLANTDLTNTKDGWIPEEQLTLVYDGITSIAQKSTGDLTIALDEPFKYEAGKNLAVLTAVNCDTYCPYVSFRQYISPLEGNAAYEWGSYYAKQWFDFTQVGHQNYYSRTASIMIYMTDAQTNGITSANTAAVAGTAYTVSDVAGRVVATGVFSEQGTVNTSGLQRGVYVVSYKVDGKRQAMKISVNK
uniref:T9SS type A sorting domain-containing protein n=1 Tax=Prevotella sp. TaxID=59823 RepID=UPI004025A64E